MSKKEIIKQITQTQKEYERVCSKLDTLNEDAYNLEKYLLYLNTELRGQNE